MISQLFLFGLLVLGLIVVLVLIDIARSLRTMSELSQRIEEFLGTKWDGGMYGYPHSAGLYAFGKLYAHGTRGAEPVNLRAGYAIWVFRSGKWELEDDRCQPGYAPGPAPAAAGFFEGDRIKQEGIAR
jgi:hypothetical protein